MHRDGLPPLDALRAFAAAARRLSFTRAAEDLSVTQSAISKQVISLEAALATRLFERKTRALALTPAGERLQRACEAAFAQLREAVTQISGDGEPVVTLATTPAFASFWLIPRIDGFRRLHPGVDIRISADTRLIDLERSRFDVAVRYLQDRQAPAQALRLFGDTLVAVCSPRLLKAGDLRLRRPADLERQVLLTYEDEMERRPWLGWPAWLEMAGVPNLRPAGSIRFNQYEAAIRAALEGQGVALAQLELVSALLKEGRLVAPLPQRFSTPRSYFLLASAHAGSNPAVDPFCAWLASQVSTAAS